VSQYCSLVRVAGFGIIAVKEYCPCSSTVARQSRSSSSNRARPSGVVVGISPPWLNWVGQLNLVAVNWHQQ